MQTLNIGQVHANYEVFQHYFIIYLLKYGSKLGVKIVRCGDFMLLTYNSKYHSSESTSKLVAQASYYVGKVL